MSNEVKEYTNGIARQRVASICLALGWNSAHNSALEVLQDLMVRYIKSIGLNMKNMAELDNRTQPDLYDAFRAMVDMNISLEELSEYVEQFDSKALVTDPVPIFPQPSETRLNHLKPGSQEVLRRPMHVHQHLPPMYPEMEVPDEPMMKPSLHEDGSNAGTVIKKEAGSGLGGSSDHAQIQDPSDLHPLREIASVMMTPHGFISPAREGRMPESRTPAVSRMVSQPSQDSSRPGSTEPHIGGQGPTKAKPSKPADDTSDEGLIEDDDDILEVVTKTPNKAPKIPKEKTPKQKQNKLSVFQQKPKSTSKSETTTPSSTKKPKSSNKLPKPPKPEKTVTDPNVKKQGPGRPKGRKTQKEVSKEFVQSSGDDSSPERPSKKAEKISKNRDLISSRMSSPPAKKARTVVAEPPVEINVDISAIPAPDPNVLPNNPLIPKFFGFENINQFDVKREKTPEPVAVIPPAPTAPSVPPPHSHSAPPPAPVVAEAVQSSSKTKVDIIPKKLTTDVISKPLEVTVKLKESKEVRKEKKLKDKAMKKAKKEKKEKHREKDKEKHKDKSEKKDKEKKKKKERIRPEIPSLFAGTDQKTTSVPKLKIKDVKPIEVKPEESKPPKIVIKNLGESSSSSSSKPKNVLKKPELFTPELFTDPSKLERPKSAASGDITATAATTSTSVSADHHPKIKIKKDKKKDSDPERKRTTSGGGKRQVEKRGSAIAAEAAIHATPQPAAEATAKPVAVEVPVPVAAPAPAVKASSAGEGGFEGGSVVTQTVGYYVDAEGNQIWICPACGKQDDGSPMIGCDECDDWYHWMCVGIQQEPADNQDWFCPRCVAKKAGMYLDRGKPTPGKRGRPPKLR